ncbi:MAG: ABC transporter ATP-binding protein/permease [Methylococcaceae bacterium]|nr:ABC transporter ATP-binding protein/permease [Methylococcaceae bacterium]
MQTHDGFFIQFVKLAGPFWNSKKRLSIRRDTVLLVFLTMLQIYIAVLIAEWNAALFDSLEQRSMPGLIKQFEILVMIFVANIAITTWHLVVKRRLTIGWRLWLTDQVVSKWMNNGRHYQMTLMSKTNHDNPDGRIAEDIRIATEEGIVLAHSFFYSILLLGSFTSMLWVLSGTVKVEIGHMTFYVSGYLVWISVIYSACASILGWWMGKPLTEATHIRQTQEANYRYTLIKTQENSQAIALLHGENNEKARLFNAFRAIVDTYALQTAAWKQIQIFSSGYSIVSMALPILSASPRYIAGTISLGPLIQSVQAFEQMVSALSWPVNNMAQIAKWRTSVERVLGLVNGMEELEHSLSRHNSHQISLEKTKKPVLRFDNVTIANFGVDRISATINNEIKVGDRVLISGEASMGAKLFEAIAGLWPWGFGHIQLPREGALFFMPPKPYLPAGSLYAAICYPSNITAFKQSVVEDLLTQVDLKEFAKQLDRVGPWEKILSTEQKQRLGLVRVLLHRPKWVFIEEALDSLTPENETQMLELLRKEIPDVAIMSITNMPMAENFHQRKLKI